MSAPVVPTSALPADVRAAGAEARALYRAALGFEQVLVRRLAASLADSADDAERSAATGIVAQLVPDALADGVAHGGGVGLARELYDALRRDVR